MSKSDEYLTILREASKVAGVRWWPKYVYHYTDINNAVNILKEGKIYSRKDVKDRMINENAGSQILEQTNDIIFSYVRFYFRPKTPTQYRNEGFLPKEYRQYEYSNVPVPIFFVFEAKDMLAKEEAMFSEIALANTGNHLTNDINEFKKFDFSKIYSEGGYRGENLTPYRRAELVVPDECDLNYLKHIWCRSNAEYITLCSMLKQRNIYEIYKDIIGVKENDSSLFFKESVYISNVNLSIDKAEISYRNSLKVKNDNMDIKYVLIIGNEKFETKTVHTLQSKVHFNKNKYQSLIEENNNEFVFQIFFDECLVFMDKYSDEETKLNELPY